MLAAAHISVLVHQYRYRYKYRYSRTVLVLVLYSRRIVLHDGTVLLNSTVSAVYIQEREQSQGENLAPRTNNFPGQ